MQETSEPVAITVVNGFLGAGKTTVIMNLINEVAQKYDNVDAANAPIHLDSEISTPSEKTITLGDTIVPKKKYNIVWLKNEFGVNEVDSLLANSSSISSVKEILNGCLCCTLVGRLGDAIEDILSTVVCDRIIIETSGSAYPAPLVQEINRMVTGAEGARKLNIRLDGVLCVIDVLNFEGYVDKTHTARMQAKYTDIILLNKHELATSEQIEKVQDDVLDLNPETPIIRTKKGWVDPDIVFGLDTNILRVLETGTETLDKTHASLDPSASDVDVVHIEWFQKGELCSFDTLYDFLHTLDQNTSCIRCKGVVFVSKKSILRSTHEVAATLKSSLSHDNGDDTVPVLVNWAFGRHMFVVLSLDDLTKSTEASSFFRQTLQEIVLKATVDKRQSVKNSDKDQTHNQDEVSLAISLYSQQFSEVQQAIIQENASIILDFSIKETSTCSSTSCSGHTHSHTHTHSHSHNHVDTNAATSAITKPIYFNRLTSMGVCINSHFFRTTVANVLPVVQIPFKIAVEKVLLHNFGIIKTITQSHLHN